MRRHSRLIILPIVLSSLLFSACLDEISAIFDIILFSESDDPEVRETGRQLAELRIDREARDLEQRFFETGDRSHLDAALELRPDDTELHGYNVVLATLGGDPTEIEATKKALTLAEAKRLAALRDDTDPETTADQIRRNVLGEILVAQTKMLGGSLTRNWDPPPDDAPPAAKQLYADYCATRNEIMTQFNDSLSYIPLPPCP